MEVHLENTSRLDRHTVLDTFAAETDMQYIFKCLSVLLKLLLKVITIIVISCWQVEPLSLMFLLSFAILLFVQFLAMLYHRYIHTHRHKHPLNFNHFTFSFYVCIWHLYSKLTDWPCKLNKKKLPTFRYWRFDSVTKKSYQSFQTILNFPHHEQGNVALINSYYFLEL